MISMNLAELRKWMREGMPSEPSPECTLSFAPGEGEGFTFEEMLQVEEYMSQVTHGSHRFIGVDHALPEGERTAVFALEGKSLRF